MAVNLSPVGGVAAQFFTSTGAVLTGGKLYTYLAGTTTPAVTYTTSQGNVPWTNPVVLDAAGRVPGSGEIWLTDGIIYKFVLKDSNDVLIATYDNITGINSNSVAYTNQQEIVTATAGQTVFNLSISYQPGTNSLSVFVDGVNQYGPGAQYSYVETDANTVTFNAGLHVGAEVKFTTTQQQGAGAVDASQVSYDPPFTNSESTNVEAKLAKSVSVWDFIPQGTDTSLTDCSTYFQNAIDYLVATGESGALYVPAGTYKLDSGLTIDVSVCTIKGDAALLDFSSFAASTGAAITLTGASINYVGNPYFNGVNVFQGLKIQGPGQAVSGNIGIKFTGSTALLGSNDYAVRDCEIFAFEKGIVMGEVAYHLLFDHCSVFLCGVAVTGEYHVNTGARNVFHRCTIYNSDYGFALYNASASTNITGCVIAGIALVSIVITSGHLCVTDCDFETGGSHGATYRVLWQTDQDYPSYAYVNWVGNQVLVKNATSTPIFGIDGAMILTITGGYLYANPAGTGGVFGSTGTGSGEVATFNWSSDYGTNPVTNFNGASIASYLHFAFTNNISASTTDVGFGTVEAYDSVISRNGVYGNNSNSTTVSALTTFTSIGVSTANGLLVVRDGTSGGMGLFLCDPAVGVVAVSNAVTGLTVSYSAGQLGFTLASGTVPRVLRWTMLQTSAS